MSMSVLRIETQGSRTGFTVVEFLVAFLAASVLAITCGVMLVHCFSALRSNSNIVELQRDMDVTTRSLYRAIRSAREADVAVSAGGKILTLDAGVRRFSFTQNGGGPDGRLTYDPNTAVSGDEQVLARNTVHAECNFTEQSDSIGIGLTLAVEYDRIEMDTDIHMRNEL